MPVGAGPCGETVGAVSKSPPGITAGILFAVDAFDVVDTVERFAVEEFDVVDMLGRLAGFCVSGRTSAALSGTPVLERKPPKEGR